MIRKGLSTITDLGGTDQICRRMTIYKLPDNVLVEVFDFYLIQPYGQKDEDAWHTLVHVCRRWRHIVFASPRRLNLQLRCTKNRPAQDMLDVWPALPIVLDWKCGMARCGSVNNILAALEQHYRISSIDISPIPNSILKKIRAMKGPFPILTDLTLVSDRKSVV